MSSSKPVVFVPLAPHTLDTLKSVCDGLKKKITYVLLITDRHHSMIEKTKVVPDVLSRMERSGEQFALTSGDTIETAQQTLKLADNDVSIIIVSPNAKGIDALIADIEKRWGVKIAKEAILNGSYAVHDLRPELNAGSSSAHSK